MTDKEIIEYELDGFEVISSPSTLLEMIKFKRKRNLSSEASLKE